MITVERHAEPIQGEHCAACGSDRSQLVVEFADARSVEIICFACAMLLMRRIVSACDDLPHPAEYHA